MSEETPKRRSMTDLILSLGYPADEIRLSAQVAYWTHDNRDYHLRSIVTHFDRLAAMVAELRERLDQPEAEPAPAPAFDDDILPF